MRYIVGIDGGGSKTLGYIGDENGTVFCKYVSGPSNYHSVGIEKVKLVLKEVIDNLSSAVGISLEEVSVISLGLAGVGRDEDQVVIKNIFNEIGFKNSLIINNDGFTALIGALGNQKGVVTICGTGSICIGLDSNRKSCRAGGWGHIIGDEGSGYSIGVNCLKAIMQSYDKIEKPTLLTAEVLKYLDLKSEVEIISYLYSDKRTKKDIAAIARIVFEVAETGDMVANRIVEEAVLGLVAITNKVIENIKDDDSRILLALDGGILRNVDMVKKRVSKAILSNSKVDIIKPIQDAGIGAFILGITSLKPGFKVANLNLNI